MDIIGILNYQTAKLLQLLKSDSEFDQVRYNFMISEIDCKFLDKDALQSFITTNEAKNLAFIRQVLRNLQNIFDLIDKAMENNNFRKIENGFNARKNDGSGFINSKLDFHAISVGNNIWIEHDGIEDKKTFYENENCYNLSLSDLAKRCSLFINWLSASYPELSESAKSKSISAKYYALLQWFYIELGLRNYFERNNDGDYSRSEIEAYAKENYPNISHQMFYRTFIEIDITKKDVIRSSFGKEYKDILIEISNNNPILKKHLESIPNS